MVRIKTKGGQVFDVEDKIACMFGRIRATLEQPDDDQVSHSLSLMSLTSSSTDTNGSITSGSSGIKSDSNPTGLTCVRGTEVVGEYAEILLEKTRGGIFALMIRWATHHRRDPMVSQFLRPDHAPLTDMPSYDQKFFSKLTRSQLFEMLQNSSFLQVPLLTEMLAKTIANELKGKSIEEIRSEFGISCDYTPEEEKAIKEDTERFLKRLRGDCDTDGEDEGPNAALLSKCEAEMTESERIAFAQNIIPLLNSLESLT